MDVYTCKSRSNRQISLHIFFRKVLYVLNAFTTSFSEHSKNVISNILFSQKRMYCFDRQNSVVIWHKSDCPHFSQNDFSSPLDLKFHPAQSGIGKVVLRFVVSSEQVLSLTANAQDYKSLIGHTSDCPQNNQMKRMSLDIRVGQHTGHECQ